MTRLARPVGGEQLSLGWRRARAVAPPLRPVRAAHRRPADSRGSRPSSGVRQGQSSAVALAD
eukprot:2523603-Alexandrium_andersonii.AAC.1